MTISIIIPSYNTAHYVCEAVESVLKSTISDYEIIVIDDESTDNTKEVIKPYLEKYSLIKYIYQKNKGLAGARNTGIENSLGKYLVFLDSDDIILPEKLKLQSEYLDIHPEIDLCYSKSINFIENDMNDTFSPNFPVFEGNVLKELWFGNFMHVNSVMVRRKTVIALGAFNPDYRELEDWDLWLRMAIYGSKFMHLSEILSMVRVRNTSMTANQKKMNLAMVKVLSNLLPTLKENPVLYKSQKKLYWHALALFKIKAKSNDILKTIFLGLKEAGISFLPIFLKLILKKIFLPVLFFQNKTTKKLEQIWNEKY